jgi:hypothetical protein
MWLRQLACKTQGRIIVAVANGCGIVQGLFMSRTIKIYRWIVFLLAAFYCLRMIVLDDWNGFGGPFRYLSVWALFLSFFCASRMMAYRSTRRWEALVGATSVVNAMVVLLYWRLYLADPASVTRDGELSVPYLELYLHALGPLLQWIDALFIYRVFRRVGPTLASLLGIVIGYFLWAELAVAPLNGSTMGAVTSGLPYPFLNDLTFDQRMSFYVTNVAVAIILLGLFASAAWAVRRRLGPARIAVRFDSPETSALPPDHL